MRRQTNRELLVYKHDGRPTVRSPKYVYEKENLSEQQLSGESQVRLH